MWEHIHKHLHWEGQPVCRGPGRQKRAGQVLGGGGHLLSCLLREVGEKVITRAFGGLGLDRRVDAEHRRFTSS